MAALRPFRGTILEENVARTSASVGEALVAGAIFTIPAFVIAGVWEQIHLVESAMIMLVGGVIMAMREDIGLSWLVAVAVPILAAAAGLIIARDNGGFYLGEQAVTVAELLLAQQYSTSAFIGAFVLAVIFQVFPLSANIARVR